ncbi:MAG: hypothetical protein ABI255_04435 [Microbacteriaceae bacterium]
MLSRLINLALLFMAGIVFGALGTVANQSVLRLGSIPLPWGVTAGLVGVGCLLIGLRLVSDSRATALAAGIGVVVAVALLSQKSFGGSVLVPANLTGVIWTVGPVLIAAVVIGWPKRTQYRGRQYRRSPDRASA